MSLNWQEIDLILTELSLEGAFIQKIRQPNYHSILLDIYSPGSGRYPLLIELASGGCRLGRLSEGTPYRKTVKLQRFAQLLRSRAQGGRITSASQEGSERVIRLAVSKAEVETILYIRLWSNAANIIAVDTGGTILDAFYRRPGKQETSGLQYQPVPKHGDSLRSARFTVRDSYAAVEGQMSFNEFIEREYETETTERMAAELLGQATALLEQEYNRSELGLKKKLEEREKLAAFEQNRHYGDLLSAYRHTIEPHAEWARVPDYDDGNREVSIRLDPRKSPGENIEAYYAAYHKARGAYDRLEEEIALLRRQMQETKDELETLRSGDEDHTEGFIARLKSIISRHSRVQKAADGKGPAPGLQFTSGIYTILVGRTAKENDALLRSWTRGNDYWLHTRDYPGGYVFIKFLPGKSVPLETILDAGNLAVYYSKARNGGKADLYYTQVKHLRRAKHGNLGTVLPTHEKNISIELDQVRLDRIFTGGQQDA